jgi:oligopeptide/dipeptide ABC transporter ATP-binding protein
MMSPVAATPLVEVRDLRLTYVTPKAGVQAIRGSGMTIAPGESVGLVGESGSGKSTLARSLLGLNDSRRILIEGGAILVQGRNVTQQSEEEWVAMRGSPLAMVFQDPLSFLNPVMRIEKQIGESIRRHDPQANLSARVDELISLVKLPPGSRRSYPHELSGGMRQRVLLAVALACRPKLLVADEPTTALDVTTQAEIMLLLRELRQKLGMAMLLISHDLGLVAQACERIYVMYAGRTIEWGPSKGILKRPAHPYTRGLFDSARALRLADGRFATIGGEVPDLAHVIGGCPFRPRCPIAQPECTTMPDATSVAGPDPHFVHCWAVQKAGVPAAVAS